MDLQESAGRSGVSEDAHWHAAYLLRGDDAALPDDCFLCRELHNAGWLLHAAARPGRRARWEVRADSKGPGTGGLTWHIQCPGEQGTLCDPETPVATTETYAHLREHPDDACWLCIDIYLEAVYVTANGPG